MRPVYGTHHNVNGLPLNIQSSASLTDFIFCHKLKTYLFHQSFPDILL